jgi:hypothetical protein
MAHERHRARSTTTQENSLTSGESDLKSFNVLAVAVIVLGLGTSNSVVSLVRSHEGFSPFALVGGLGLGAGLATLWLALRWDRRTPATKRACLALAVVLGPLLVLGLSLL